VAVADVDGAGLRGIGLHACTHRVHESWCGGGRFVAPSVSVLVAEVSQVVLMEEVAAAGVCDRSALFSSVSLLIFSLIVSIRTLRPLISS